MVQTKSKSDGADPTGRTGVLKTILHWYTKLFAVWIVLFAVVGYFFPQPFVFLAKAKMFGAGAEQWPEVFQSLRSPNLWFFALTMFGIGAVLTVDDFKNIAKRPVIVLIGSVAQFTIMPLGAFALAKLFGLPPMLAAGLIIAGCAPGAMSSNVMSYLAKADVAYSVSLTTVSTLLCPLLTPALTKWLAGATLPVDFWKMFFDIIFMVVLLLNVYGMAAGYGVGKLFGMPFSQKRTLSIEIGMQNAGLGTVLAIEHFGPEAAIPTAFFVFTCIITASVMTEIWKNRSMKER